ncbi:carbohydrate kinase [Ruficoccus amylovorans]|uniref:Carbohydrate kinase n=1 Tax=Ruficoccus amylovorans TaxID=1804625 RepID=A0A842HGS7_9BACT|nr:bifunctional ADP-heptose synthase [Ruficoccus amylovorans]MBC2595622.1 carbohydrate kinase [Ruficoccus amylovorans]
MTSQELLDHFKETPVLVVGDLMLDHYLWGDATRISPEAPVPVVAQVRDTYTAGGAANVAMNLAALGAPVELFGWTGRDRAGDILLDVLERNGIVYSSQWRSERIPTIEKTRVMVRQQQLCRIDREDHRDAYAFDSDACLKVLEKKIAAAKAVIVSDYAKGVVTEKLLSRLLEFREAGGCLIAVDPKPKRKLNVKGMDLITPNRDESLQMAGISIDPHDPFPETEVTQGIWEHYAPRHLVVTLGADGMLVCDEGKVAHRIPTVAREVFDVSGAGDTVIATLTLALAAGAAIEEAAHLANRAAGIAIGKLGTATVTPKEILDYEIQH